MGRGPHIPAGLSPVPPLPLPCFVALEKSLSSPEPLLTLLVRGIGRLVPCPPPSLLSSGSLTSGLTCCFVTPRPQPVSGPLQLMLPGTFFLVLHLHILSLCSCCLLREASGTTPAETEAPHHSVSLWHSMF